MASYQDSDLPTGFRVVAQTDNFAQLQCDGPLYIQDAEALLSVGLGVISFSSCNGGALIACRKERDNG